jgi:hypothetical protein
MIFGNTTFGRAILPAFILASASFANAATVIDYMPTRDTYMRGNNDPVLPQLLNGLPPVDGHPNRFSTFTSPISIGPPSMRPSTASSAMR